MEVYHPLFECWTKSLYEAVFEGNAIREGDTLFVILKTDKEYEKYLKKQTY